MDSVRRDKVVIDRGHIEGVQFFYAQTHTRVLGVSEINGMIWS
jgi:hypothetical protein